MLSSCFVLHSLLFSVCISSFNHLSWGKENCFARNRCYRRVLYCLVCCFLFALAALITSVGEKRTVLLGTGVIVVFCIA